TRMPTWSRKTCSRGSANSCKTCRRPAKTRSRSTGPTSAPWPTPTPSWLRSSTTSRTEAETRANPASSGRGRPGLTMAAIHDEEHDHGDEDQEDDQGPEDPGQSAGPEEARG